MDPPIFSLETRLSSIRPWLMSMILCVEEIDNLSVGWFCQLVVLFHTEQYRELCQFQIPSLFIRQIVQQQLLFKAVYPVKLRDETKRHDYEKKSNN